MAEPLNFLTFMFSKINWLKDKPYTLYKMLLETLAIFQAPEQLYHVALLHTAFVIVPLLKLMPAKYK